MFFGRVSSRFFQWIRGNSCLQSPEDAAAARARKLEQKALERAVKYKRRIKTYAMRDDAMEEALCDFCLNLMRHVDNRPSYVSSPASIALILAAMTVGAKERTLAELKAALSPADVDQKTFNAFFSQLLKRIAQKSKNGILKAANRIYVDVDRILLDDFKAQIERLFPGILKCADFGKAAETAREINEWAHEMTEGMIPSPLSADVISKDEPVVGLNAIFFHCMWEQKFMRSHTHMTEFHFNENDSVTMKMMSMKEEFLLYAQDDTWQILGMPFEGYQSAMFVFLPKQRFGLATSERTLTGQNCLQLMKDAGKSVTLLNMYLPRFKVSADLEAKEILQRMGVKSAFDAADADFSGMDGDGNAASKLRMGQIAHAAVLEANEWGTKAAALTVVREYTCCGFDPPPLPVPLFRADHPFLFFLVHRSSVVFAGRCGDACVLDQTPINYRD